MSQNHSLSVFEIIDVQVEELTSKGGTKYKKYTCPAVIRRDDGVSSVGNVVLMDLPKSPLKEIPKAGHFHPHYEPRPQWDSPDAAPALIRLVPVASVKPAASAPKV